VKKLIVIGAGLAGLTAAAQCARKGYDVTVLEKNDAPGGVARTLERGGFTFDMGPTWYLMAEVFDRFFAEFGKTTADYFELTALDPSYTIHFEDGRQAHITRDLSKVAALFEGLEPGAGKKLKGYLEESEYKYRTALDEFLYREYNSIFDFFNKKMLFEGMKLRIFQKLDPYLKRYFISEKIRKILEYNIVFLGCSPFKSPALYSLMSHVDLVQGVSYPMGGIGSLVRAVYDLAREQGVNFHFNSEVSSIEVKDGRAERVIASTGNFKGDIVLNAADYRLCEKNFLRPEHRTYSDRYWNKRLLAPTAFLIYLGLNKKIPGLSHHTLYLAEDWDRHFETIFDRPAWPDNPSFYIGCPSKTDSSVAPENGENLFVLVPVAPGLDDSDKTREQFADRIISKIESLTGETIRDSIIVKQIVSHCNFKELGYFKGTSLGLAHTLFQTAFFRPAHRSKRVSNLYFTGHYTHPGIGMPMVVIASHVISDKILREMGA